MKIEIEVLVDIFDTAFPSELITEAEASKESLESKGVSIEFPYRDWGFEFIEHIVVTLVVTFTATVAAEVFASWLYDKIKGRAQMLRIERTLIEADEDGIKKILLEKLEES